MLQAELSNRLGAVLESAKTELRGLAVEATKQVLAIRDEVTSQLEVELADGRKAFVEVKNAVVAVEGQYASKVADLEALVNALHPLLGENPRVNTPAVEPEPAPVAEVPAAEPAHE